MHSRTCSRRLDVIINNCRAACWLYLCLLINGFSQQYVDLHYDESRIVYLVQLLLPLYDNQKQPFSGQLFQQVHQELLSEFGGLTAYTRSPAAGLWQASDVEAVRDDVVIHEVMTDKLDRPWWQRYRLQLEERFQQEKVIVRAHKVALL